MLTHTKKLSQGCLGDIHITHEDNLAIKSGFLLSFLTFLKDFI